MRPERPLLSLMALFLAITFTAAQETDFRTEARAAMSRYDYSKAIELFDKALETTTDDEAAIRELSLQKARCQKKMLRYDAAAETLASVLKPGVMDVEVAGELAECHVSSGKLADAFLLYNLLSLQHPDNLYFSIQKASLLFKMNDFEGCLDEGKAICSRDSIPSVLSLVGASALKLGQVDTSLAYYRKALRLNPLNPGTVTSISNILLGKKDYDGVIDLTKGFLEEVPDNLSVGQILGVAYYLKDDQDNAYEVFKQLRKDGDESYGTMFYSGMNALSLNRFTVARECFGNAWQIDSTDAKLATNYAISLFKDNMVPKNQIAAKRLLLRAVELTDPDPVLMYKIHNGLAQLYYNVSDVNNALPHYEKAFSYYPEDKGLLISIGYCHEVRKEYKTALQYYERYLKEGKENTKNWNFAKQAITHIKSELHMQE
ncbi:MAG: tetratricopeptide repeat protein [Bacteroidales bacterium]|nr:tetratricopeptide repeat protein [Bacteroidales bacterium]